MLDSVALNQARFNTPQVTPDNRGIALGKLGALLFSSVDRMVGFFRVFCDESSIDELLPKLAIVQVQSALGSRELLVLVPATTSYLLDRCARITRLFGGLAFTGSGKHFVRYRDEAAPLGYDIQALSPEPGDFLVYNDSFTQSYTRIKELPFDQLLLRLSLRRLPGPDPAPPDEPVWLVAQPGLGRSVLSYLWRNHVEAYAAQVQGGEGGDGTAAQGSSAFGARASSWLVRVARMPSRIRRLFTNMPGVELHRAVSGECLVEMGFRHPVRLEACTAVLDKSRFYIFSGTRDTVEVLAAPPPLTPAASLFDSDYALRRESGRPTKGAPARAPSPKAIGLRIEPTPGLPRRVAATLVEWRHVAWLRQLIYTLPAAILDGARAAALDEGFLVLGAGATASSDAGLEALPLGRFFFAAAPSVLVPFGYEVVPRLSPSVLAEHVGGTDGRVVLFVPHATAPIVVLATDLELLSRRTIARLEIAPRPRDERWPSSPPPLEVNVVNEPLALFPLWGFAKRGDGEQPQLPARSTFADAADAHDLADEK